MGTRGIAGLREALVRSVTHYVNEHVRQDDGKVNDPLSSKDGRWQPVAKTLCVGDALATGFLSESSKRSSSMADSPPGETTQDRFLQALRRRERRDSNPRPPA